MFKKEVQTITYLPQFLEYIGLLVTVTWIVSFYSSQDVALNYDQSKIKYNHSVYNIFKYLNKTLSNIFKSLFHITFYGGPKIKKEDNQS